jgi:hypothetical protein
MQGDPESRERASMSKRVRRMVISFMLFLLLVSGFFGFILTSL